MNNSFKSLPTTGQRIHRTANLLKLNSLEELGYVNDVITRLAALAELSNWENAERIADLLETAHDLASFVKAAEEAMQHCDDDLLTLRREDSTEILAKKLIATPGVLEMMFIVRCVVKADSLIACGEAFDSLMKIASSNDVINEENPNARFLFKQFSDEKNKMIQCILDQTPELCGSATYTLDVEAHERGETIYKVETISEQEAVAMYESNL